jgi:hypothetical protein
MTESPAPDRELDALDAPDPELDALSADVRAEASRVWAMRAQSELGASAVFAELTAAMKVRDAAPEVTALLAQAIVDEERHAEICRAIARRYGDTADPGLRRPQRLPQFGRASAPLNTTFNVVLNCCISETVAVEFLRTCRAEARTLTVRSALRLLLRDEVDHARAGWAHLASSQVSAAERREVSVAAPMLAGIARAAWTKSDGPPATAAAGHGWLSDEHVGELFDAVWSHVIVPGLHHVGVECDTVLADASRGR